MMAAALLAGCAVAAEAAEEPATRRPAVEYTVRGGLPNFYRQAEGGMAPLRVAYFGGSITAAGGWRVQTLAWFRESYPAAEITEINGAISGTNVGLGVYRLDYDVLRHKPDLLFVECAVNDGGTSAKEIHRGMEGVVRKVWQASPETDICFVYTLTGGMVADFAKGVYPHAASCMEDIADYYGIPSIHLGYDVARRAAEGKLIFKSAEPEAVRRKALQDDGVWHFTNDNVHPYADTGHPLYTEAIKRGFAAFRAAVAPAQKPHALAAPYRADNLENARTLPLSAAKLTGSWRRQDSASELPAKNVALRLPELWQAAGPGATLELRFKGTEMRIYGLVGPDCGQVSYSVDDGPLQTVTQISRGYWSDCYILGTINVAMGLEDKVHSVKMFVAPEPIADKLAVLQMSPKYRELTAEALAASPLSAQHWYAGNILLVGEIVP